MIKNIRTHRIKAFLYRHWAEVIATIDRKVDIVFWPAIDLLAFGLLTVYIDRLDVRAGVASAILGGLILWTLVYNIQRDITVSLLEDAWSKNLYNMFSSPLSVAEVIIGTFLLSFAKAVLTISFLLFVAWSVFGLNLFIYGFAMAFFVLNIFMFGWAFGYITSSLIFRLGLKVQILAWSLIAILYPISGVFYPLDTLPEILRGVAHLFPISYTFEGLRNLILTGALPDTAAVLAMVFLNLGYLALGIFLFVRGFYSAKSRGWFIHPS